MEDSPSLDIGDGSFDLVADAAVGVVGVFLGAGEGSVGWFPVGGDHGGAGVALVAQVPGRLGAIVKTFFLILTPKGVSESF